MIKTASCRVTVIAILACTILFAPLVSADQNSAQNAINSAKNVLKNCYTAVFQAEAPGANVSSLVMRLNQAAGSLSMAELAYAGKNYDSASSYASQAQSKMSGLIDEASDLKQAAASTAAQNEKFTIWSLLFSLAILSTGVAFWFVLNWRERRLSSGT